MSTLADRVQEIMSEFNLSSKDFAEKVGVQRSSISHIISGRNKPSLDFIMKLTKAFPHLNSKWLLHGKEGMIKKPEPEHIDVNQDSSLQSSQKVTSVTSEPKQDQTSKEEPEERIEEKPFVRSENIDEQKSVNRNSTSSQSITPEKDTQRKLAKVILVYSDGSFEELNPNS